LSIKKISGETVANKQKVLQGHSPGELTEIGFLQANVFRIK
jgi:broad specificity phosphatase PhoE